MTARSRRARAAIRGLTAALRGLGFVTLAVPALALTPIPNRVAARIEMAPRLEPADAIVVLGNGVNSDGSLYENSLRSAVDGMNLYGQGLAPLVVFSGNYSGAFNEAEVRERLARTLGMQTGSILIETRANTTREEARDIAALLKLRGVKRVLLVTAPFHLRRAVPLFERRGFVLNVMPEAVLVMVTWATSTGFGSLYLAQDLIIVPISYLQGVALLWWNEVSATVLTIDDGRR